MENETCLCFPSYRIANRCREFIKVKTGLSTKVRILQLCTPKPVNQEERLWRRECKITVVFVDEEIFPIMKQYWQHSGEIVSSRMAEYILHELEVKDNLKKMETTNNGRKSAAEDENRVNEEYIETRFGRSLNFLAADKAKFLIRKRIATKVVEKVDSESLTDLFSFEHYNENSAPFTTGNGEPLNDDQQLNSNVPAEAINSAGESSANSTFEDMTTEDLNYHVNPDTDVYLFPSGMASIFTAHRLLLNFDANRLSRSSTRQDKLVGYGPPFKKTVMFGFPYTDTLSILRKFNHTHFLGQGDSTSMDALKKILHSGEQILAVFIEAPSNPLLKMGDLQELKRLSDLYSFYIVVDETVGGFVNIDVLPYADIICSSLTKIFSGDSNVIAGSLVLNPRGKIYEFAKKFMKSENGYEDCLWCEDALCLERNSRDFVERTIKVNTNTDVLLTKVLLPQVGKLFKKIYYPSLTSEETKRNYDSVMATRDGGYGGLFSLTFFDIEKAKKFFNNLELCKGPSLGTNFTLACPYAIIAHYQELDEIAQYGVEKNLVRVSVGLENSDVLCRVFQRAIEKDCGRVREQNISYVYKKICRNFQCNVCSDTTNSEINSSSYCIIVKIARVGKKKFHATERRF
ncbi:Str2p [Saccharomyces cerevisiae x Saccharomyces kudriavzevii VIN7]|uniref:cystathionine gamma-synthase n=1 Tax=Saccharomyces cerevisiae x Saccharomyces kudriavzevii (strain VIN7) TaxID=1095631 RepID=H0GX63_SACCK|nr:Str2p [Saccharomyces cerevisiae x Saccharomyces kudriavzevii VIN7]